MRRLNWEIKLGIFLILASALLYLLHFAIFKDAHHIFVYGVAEIAFLPLEVLLVALIIHRLLDEQKKHETMVESIYKLRNICFDIPAII